jgi:Tol biopolymer transport system component
MGARGRHKRVLVPGEGRNFIEDLAWAPGAGRVVLVMFRGGGVSDLWVYTLATRRLAQLHVARHPDRVIQTVDWSRNGTIVFSAIDFRTDAQEDEDLSSVRPDGSGLRQLTNTPRRSEESPRFSPDGRRLVYNAWFDRCRYLVVANSDGTKPRRAGAGCNTWGASWSPNSRRLLVQILNGRKLRDEIWAMHVDGSGKRFIVAGTNASWRPR